MRPVTLGVNGETRLASESACGTSWPAGFPSTMPDEVVLSCARYQGSRLARFSRLLAADRSAVA
jgi:hypothetical protein